MKTGIVLEKIRDAIEAEGFEMTGSKVDEGGFEGAVAFHVFARQKKRGGSP